MKVAAVVLTYQAISTGRLDLLKDTIISLKEADQVFVVDNGSTDGTEDLMNEWGGTSHRGSVHTSFYGTQLCARTGVGAGSVEPGAMRLASPSAAKFRSSAGIPRLSSSNPEAVGIAGWARIAIWRTTSAVT